jgi:hypothetical protein
VLCQLVSDKATSTSFQQQTGEPVARLGRALPHGDTGKDSSSKEHANVHGRRLDRHADSHDDASQLHESDTAEFITDEYLHYGSDCFASNVNRNNLKPGV